MTLWTMFIWGIPFQYPEKKKTTEKSEAKNLCVEVHWGGGGGGRGGGGRGVRGHSN